MRTRITICYNPSSLASCDALFDCAKHWPLGFYTRVRVRFSSPSHPYLTLTAIA